MVNAHSRERGLARCAQILPTALLVLTLGSAAAGQLPNIAYDKLNDCQRTRFETFPSYPPGQKTWESAIDDSQRLEYAGGTQALSTADIQFPGCMGLGGFSTTKAIWGSRPSHPSAEQFNIEVGWTKDADKKFESAKHWTEHVAWLHPGQHGYQENRNGNPFLGIVVLFDDNGPDRGQFHVGFRSLFAHYSPDNGNVAKNYPRYCGWYGKINGYSEPCDHDIAVDWKSVNDAELPAVDLSQAPLKDVVREFLQDWYVKQNMDELAGFVARDNAMDWSVSLGALPRGVSRSEWDTLFTRAFVDGPGTVRFPELASAIQLPQPIAAQFFDQNEQTIDHVFAILSPNGIAGKSYFPPDDVPDGQLDASASFLRHLKREYFREPLSENRLNVVAFVNAGKGLVQEGCILYWIKEAAGWKLAAFQGTD